MSEAAIDKYSKEQVFFGNLFYMLFIYMLFIYM